MPQNLQNVSVTLKYISRDQIGLNTSILIPRLTIAYSVFGRPIMSYDCVLCRDHNVMDLLEREHREISAETAYQIAYRTRPQRRHGSASEDQLDSASLLLPLLPLCRKS